MTFLLIVTRLPSKSIGLRTDHKRVKKIETMCSVVLLRRQHLLLLKIYSLLFLFFLRLWVLEVQHNLCQLNKLLVDIGLSIGDGVLVLPLVSTGQVESPVNNGLYIYFSYLAQFLLSCGLFGKIQYRMRKEKGIIVGEMTKYSNLSLHRGELFS